MQINFLLGNIKYAPRHKKVNKYKAIFPQTQSILLTNSLLIYYLITYTVYMVNKVRTYVSPYKKVSNQIGTHLGRGRFPEME